MLSGENTLNVLHSQQIEKQGQQIKLVLTVTVILPWVRMNTLTASDVCSGVHD